MDTYPTIDGCIEHVRAMMTVDGDECLGWDMENRCVHGKIALVPLPEGWRLVNEPCRTCGGCGCELWCAKDEPFYREVGCVGSIECPTCFGAGGFPLLQRPCDCGCHRTDTKHYDGKVCCVSGWVNVRPTGNPGVGPGEEVHSGG
jgi:hypothetical protein